MGKMKDEGLEVRCTHCKAPWLVSRRAYDEATSIIVREFPPDCLVAMPVDIGYLCPKCLKAHEAGELLPPPERRPRRRTKRVS